MARQLVPQSVPVAVVVAVRKVMWLPKTAHQYVVSVIFCSYGHVPHLRQAMLVQQTGLVAERTFDSISGARPTAA
jgi:hypothetical protein